MIPCSEVLFLDPLVDDADTILRGLRPGVEAVVSDADRPAARQIARALADHHDLNAIHIIAHGSPGQVGFAAGAWSAETLDEQSNDLAAIGHARVRAATCGSGVVSPAPARRARGSSMA